MIRIYDTQFQIQGIIDNYNSIKWVDRYYSNGDFTVKIPFSLSVLEFLKINAFLTFEEKAGFIESISLDMTDGQETITIYGKDLTALLGRRIIWSTVNFNGTAEDFFYQIVNENCITTEEKRIIPLLSNEQKKGYPELLQKQVSYQNILECFEELSEELQFGYKIRYDKTGKMVFEVYKGIDRTVHQQERAPTIFSTDFENILEQSYSKSISDYCNTALVLSEGEGQERYQQIIENGEKLERYELYVDAKDLQKGELSTEDYNQQLLQRGKEKLAECKQIETFDTTINVLTNMEYGLGDMVTTRNAKWGLTLDTRITEIETIVESDGRSVNLTFGNNVPSIYKKIKKKG